MKYLSVDSLKKKFTEMHPGAVVTQGQYSIQSYCSSLDLEWNQMDQEHRPFIHSTYLKSVRVWTQEEAQFSLSLIKILGISFYTLVTDVRIKKGVYCQSFSFFNLIYVHALTECSDDLHKGEWFIFSHWVLKPLHYFINKKMLALNERQNPEDVPLRKKRFELRHQGYRFAPDENLNFLTANTSNHNVIYPTAHSLLKVKLSEITETPKRFTNNLIDVILCRDNDGQTLAWHAVCPHEGGPLAEGSFCERQLTCPWHGFQFSPVILGKDEVVQKLQNLSIRQQGDEVVISSGQ